jgi:hypothetical protein
MSKKPPFTLPLVGDVLDFARLLATAVGVLVAMGLAVALLDWASETVRASEMAKHLPGVALALVDALSGWIERHAWHVAGVVFGWVVLKELHATRQIAKEALEQGARTLSAVQRLELEMERRRSEDDVPPV